MRQVEMQQNREECWTQPKSMESKLFWTARIMELCHLRSLMDQFNYVLQDAKIVTAKAARLALLWTKTRKNARDVLQVASSASQIMWQTVLHVWEEHFWTQVVSAKNVFVTVWHVSEQLRTVLSADQENISLQENVKHAQKPVSNARMRHLVKNAEKDLFF